MSSDNAKLLTSRYQLVRLGLVLFALVVVGRLFYLQVIRHEYYTVKADSAHLKKLTIEAKRGEIFTRTPTGELEPLAVNQTLKRVVADPRFVGDAQLTAEAVAEATGGKPTDYLAKLAQQDSGYEVLEAGVDVDTGLAIEELNLKGVFLQDVTNRVYPERSLAAHLLGFVNAEGDGQYGVEQFMNDELSGQDGLLSGAFDTRGAPIATTDNVSLPAVDGHDLVLSIDRNVQAKVERALAAGHKEFKADSASAVVMDPRNGKIIAMANYPTYDPGQYRQAKDISVFTNSAISSPYEPGSVFKPLAMALGLETDAVQPDTTYYDAGQVKIDNFTIGNAGDDGPATRDMTEVITKSVNTGMVYVLQNLAGNPEQIDDADKQALYEFYSGKLRLDDPTGVELAGESLGILTAPDSSSDARYANMSFGQGVSVTMIQNLAAAAAIINGGTYYQPSVIDSLVDADGEADPVSAKVLENDVVSPQTSAEMREMMKTVVDRGGGLVASRSGYYIGGKTGSAQVADRQSGGYIEDAEIGSFIGFGAGEEPSYIAMVRVDQPGYTRTPYAGSGAAAPIFADISDWLIDYYGYPAQ